MATLLEQVKEKFKGIEYDTYCSDLYFKHSTEVMEFIKSIYPYHDSIKTFKNNIGGKLWIDIPFGYGNEYFKERYN